MKLLWETMWLNDSLVTTFIWLTWDYLDLVLVRSWRGVFATSKASRWPASTPRACRWSVEASRSRAVSSAAWRRSPTSTSISSSLMWWDARDVHTLTLCRCNQGWGRPPLVANETTAVMWSAPVIRLHQQSHNNEPHCSSLYCLQRSHFAHICCCFRS